MNKEIGSHDNRSTPTTGNHFGVIPELIPVSQACGRKKKAAGEPAALINLAKHEFVILLRNRPGTYARRFFASE